jgi:phosphinothricin acetyltransferase
MTAADAVAAGAAGADAGERFRSSPEPRIAKCADHDPWTPDDLAPFIEAGHAWVATEDGEVVGFALVEVFDGAAHVEEVSVDRAHGGRGHATALLDAIATWARRAGLPAVTLTTFRDVAWNRPFYERRGFRVVDVARQSPAMRDRVAHEEDAYGLAADLRVVMRRGLAAPPVTIRDATAADLPAITELFNALIPTTTIAWRDHLADDDEMATWFAAQQELGQPVLVAEHTAGGVVGYTTWTWFRGGPRFPGYATTRELTIHVDGDHHGHGVGRTLIEALVERARRDGIHVLVAGVDADNAASIAFHERLGFVEVARMPQVGRKFDRWLDLVLLQRTTGGPELS